MDCKILKIMLNHEGLFFSGVNAPTSQSLLNYILLALVYGGTLLYKRQHMTVCLDAAFPTHGNV